MMEALKAEGKLGQIGGDAYLPELVGQVASPANAESHARIVLRKSQLRKLIHSCTRAVDQCYHNPDEIDDVVNPLEQAIFQLTLAKGRNREKPLAQVISQYLDELDNRKGNPGSLIGVPTGYSDLDHLTSGWRPGDMIVLAGRPSMGKTASASASPEMRQLRARSLSPISRWRCPESN